MRYWVFLCVAVACHAAALESKNSVTADYESNLFFADGQQTYRTDNSAALELETVLSWQDGQQRLTIKPFFRVDERDDERTHGDMREFIWHKITDDFEVKAGIGKVFWGVTESQHLVDIINQTDLVEKIDGEEKLGQPMVQLLLEREWGNLDLFILPYQRERTFAGPKARLLGSLPLAAAQYQSADEQRHTDVAGRWYHYVDELELAVSYFQGTSREPALGIQADGLGGQKLLTYYPLIRQTGLELQYLYEGWAWKFEGIYRTGMPQNDLTGGAAVIASPLGMQVAHTKDFWATTAGFEYTQVGVFDSRVDLGWVAEHLYDSRQDKASAGVGEHDVLLATRWTFNDEDDSTLLAGVLYDYDYRDYSMSVEGSKRLTENLKAELEVRFFDIRDQDNPAYALRNEDFARLTFSYYY
jgi:hypothetical protein